MTVGMELYAASGILNVSTEFLTYFCRKTSTATTVARVGGNTNPSSLVIPVTGYTNPIVAFVGTNGLALSGKDASGNLVFACTAAVGVVITYYLFDQSNNLPISHVGLQLHNAAGQIVFNTSSHPMLALGAILSPNATGSLTTTVSTQYTGKTVAIAPMAMGGHRKAGILFCNASGTTTIWNGSSACGDVQYQNDGKVYGGKCSATDTVLTSIISWDDVKISAGNSTSYTIPPDYNAPVTILAIDVTGIPLNTTFF